MRFRLHSWVCISVLLFGFCTNAPASPDSAPLPLNTVTTAQIEAVLKAGPHAIIRSFLVEPAYRARTFLGFKLVAKTPHPVFGTNSPLNVGDIIVSANDVRLETPAQYMEAWERLKTGAEFSLVYLRDGKRQVTSWKRAK